MASFGKMNDV